MTTPDFTAAAMEPFNVGPEIDAAIAAGDIEMAYRLAPHVGRLDVPEQIGIRAKLRAKFGVDLVVKKWDEATSAPDPELTTKSAAPSPEPDGPDLLSHPHTDSGNAERIVAVHGRDLRYCVDSKKWLVWDGIRWAVDDLKAAKQRAKITARLIYVQAAGIPDKDFREATEKHARKSESAGGINHALECAEHEPGIPIRYDSLDSDHWLLNVNNGTVDLKTGDLRPPRREDLITKLAPVQFDPTARCPIWDRFLSEVFEPHPDIIPFIQRAVGYSLTGETREECLFLLHGDGRNGKGTLLKLLAAALGDYAGTADFSAFVEKKNDTGPRDDIANMRGRRLISAQESRDGATLAEAIIKWLTGGDLVRARLLYENSTEFDPTWKIWLASNNLPVIKGTDPAIWSRIKLVPFSVSFVGREDKTLKSRLQAELPGILNWAVEGCLRWQESGLEFPASVVTATSEYRADSDQIGRFLDDCCIVGEFASARARELYGAYHRWVDGAGEDSLTETSFGKRMGERGFEKRRTVYGTSYDGIGIRSKNTGDDRE